MEENTKRFNLKRAKHLASMHIRVIHGLTQSWWLQPEISRLQDSIRSFMENRPNIDIEDHRSRVIKALTRFEKAHEENEDFLYGFDYYTRILPNERINWTNHVLLRVLVNSKKSINEAYQEGIDISTYPDVQVPFFRVADGYFISENLAKVKAFKHEINEEMTKRKVTPNVKDNQSKLSNPELATLFYMMSKVEIIRGLEGFETSRLTIINMAHGINEMTGNSVISLKKELNGKKSTADFDLSPNQLNNIKERVVKLISLIDKELGK